MSSRPIESALLIDDDDVFRTTLMNSLRRRGVAARTAATTEEALTLLEDAPVELVVVDHRMPRGNGLLALSRIRRLLPEAVLIMLTGYGDIPLAVEAVKEGADTLCTKPIDPDQLLRVAAELKASQRTASLPRPSLSYNLEEMEREAIKTALRDSGGNVMRAAALLGIDRRTLQRKLKKIF
jgi:two-component system response regulator RegA